ncbi:MAG: circularly permuted type 2 ATP-grasp protein, partial [Pseudomonadota bacterium]
MMIYDEMGDGEAIRAPYARVKTWIDGEGVRDLGRKQKEAETIFRKVGITFCVYGEGGDPERLIPFDLVPRVFSAEEWAFLSKGVEQRAKALNHFIWDVYHDRRIISEGLIPEELVLKNSA